MKFTHYFLIVVFSLVSFGSSANSEKSFHLGKNIKLADNQTAVSDKLANYCQSITNFRVETPQYSLAEKSEVHLICNQYKDAKFQFERAVFTIADNQLKQVQAKGFDFKAIVDYFGEPEGEYLGISVYQKGRYWLDKKANRFVWLAKEGLHPNLFAWHNPLLVQQSYPPTDQSIIIPDLLDFNSTLDKLLPQFEKDCPLSKVDIAKRIWLPNKPQSQTQVNCFAYSYAGFPRKMEAVFGDGKLHVVWVLSGKQEEARLRSLLTKEFGEPSIVNEKWEVFENGRISLRKDKPELLILSDEMIPLYMEMLKQSEE